MIQIGVEEFAVKVGADRRIEACWRRPDLRRETDAGKLAVDSLRHRTIDFLVELLRSNRLNREDDLRLLGDHLFVTLFGGPEPNMYNPVGHLFKEAVSSSPEDGTRRLLRVALEIEGVGDRLDTWPWEYLHVPAIQGDSDTSFFLSKRASLVLTRVLPLSKQARAISVDPPIKVLFVALSPRGLVSVQYERVLEALVALRDSLGEAGIQLRVLAEEYGSDGHRYTDLERDQPMTTYESFRSSVERYAPHVIHIVGHGRYVHPGSPESEGYGSGGQLAFREIDHTPRWINDETLAEDLMDIPSLRLVFLQACESADTSQASPYQVIAGLAQWLAFRNIPAVVAMHFKVQHMLANQFARTFYDQLAGRQPIEVAILEARRELPTGGGDAQLAGFGQPVLYLRGSGALLSPLESVGKGSRSRGPRPAAARHRAASRRDPLEQLPRPTVDDAGSLPRLGN